MAYGHEFMAAVGPHLKGLRTLVSIRMAGTGRAEDVLQEALAAAYARWVRSDASQAANPTESGETAEDSQAANPTESGEAAAANLRAWLFAVARNKCADAYRAMGREVPASDAELEARLGPHGRDDPQQRLWDVRQAVRLLPPREREAVELHYFGGLSLAEIARAQRAPEGTVKRRLHDARQRLKRSLSDYRPAAKGSDPMSNQTHPLPHKRPEISIAPLGGEAFSVVCPEALWMFESTRVGTLNWFGLYDAPDWTLSDVARVETLRPAKVHGIACAEVEFTDMTPDGTVTARRRVYVGEVGGEVKTLAALRERDGASILETYLDPDFDDNWNSGVPAYQADEGRFQESEPGVFTTVKPTASLGAGCFRVTLGAQSHECLRVLDAQDGILIEGFLTRDGSALLTRRYNHPMWKIGPGARYGEVPWDRRLAGHAKIWIDGQVYVHWYDAIGTGVR